MAFLTEKSVYTRWFKIPRHPLSFVFFKPQIPKYSKAQISKIPTRLIPKVSSLLSLP